MRKIIKVLTSALAVACSLLFSAVIHYSEYLPDRFSSDSGVIHLNTALKITAVPSENLSPALSLSNSPDTSSVQLMLMGVIPVKNAEVHKIIRPELTPCGKPFGIKMLMDGVMVIRTGNTKSGTKDVSPAADADIRKGDIIKSVNGNPVYSYHDIEEYAEKSCGREISLTILRDGTKMVKNLRPAVSDTDKTPKLGLWVRDSSAGIGTVTYCDTETGTFAGLGHPVCDSDTGRIIPMSEGEVMSVSISGVKKGKAGSPGELQGFFCEPDCCGALDSNSSCGVFGTIDRDFSENEKLPVAMAHEVCTGEAHIYSTVEGTEPETYTIDIKKIIYEPRNSSHNMIIKITDPELISKTGGIVQGMSGSPIIQNGMLVGAVTHVFVNDPTMGYAIFCENMYSECGGNG